jgi:arsenate reductase-like glutaredoxin family protein
MRTSILNPKRRKKMESGEIGAEIGAIRQIKPDIKALLQKYGGKTEFENRQRPIKRVITKHGDTFVEIVELNPEFALLMKTSKLIHKKVKGKPTVVEKVRQRLITASELKQILNNGEKDISELIKTTITVCNGGLTAQELSKLLKVNIKTIYTKIGEMIKRNIIRSEKDKWGFRVYQLNN